MLNLHMKCVRTGEITPLSDLASPVTDASSPYRDRRQARQSVDDHELRQENTGIDSQGPGRVRDHRV
jgi:hypothetical protein